MKKAHGVLEIALLLCFVVAISFAAMTMFNNQKFKLADMSKSHLNSQSVNLGTLKPSQLEFTVNYNKIETAGTNALTYLGMDSNGFKTAMSDVTYAKLKSAATGGDDDLFNITNQLITTLNLNYEKVSAQDVNINTLSTVIGVLNAAANTLASENTTTGVKELANSYITQIRSLLDLKS